MAADPTYPLLPIFCFLSAILLLGLFTTNFARHSWNLGVTFLCFWLFWENLLTAINAIIWADNANIKLYVFCDIVSHLYVFAAVVKPACTLILTRRLYKIASLHSLVADSRREKMVDAVIEWSLGFGLPALVTGVFYYIVQGARFGVFEGAGCDNAVITSGLEIILIELPSTILPLISVFFYCPKIVHVFYKHSRDTNRFLLTNGSVSRGGYSRILALGCLDIFLSLPFGLMRIASGIRSVPPGFFQFYNGWDFMHSNWKPVSFTWEDIVQGGSWTIFNFYFSQWSSVVLALAIFALFGFTAEARATYKRAIYAALKLFGWTPPACKQEDMGELRFGIRSLVASGQTGTQQSGFAAVLGEQTDGGDAEQRLHGASAVTNISSNSRSSSVSWHSGSPNIGTATIFQAEVGDSELAGNGESSNVKDKAVRARDGDHEGDQVEPALHGSTGPLGLT